MNTTFLLILIFTDGERVTREIKRPTSKSWRERRDARQAALAAIGKEFEQTAEYWAGSVLIDDTDVFNYNGSETREILGLL